MLNPARKSQLAVSRPPTGGSVPRGPRRPPEHTQEVQTQLDVICLPPSWTRTEGHSVSDTPACTALAPPPPVRSIQRPASFLALGGAWHYLSLRNEQSNKLFTQEQRSTRRIRAKFCQAWPRSWSSSWILVGLGRAGTQSISASSTEGGAGGWIRNPENTDHPKRRKSPLNTIRYLPREGDRC